MVGFSTSGNWNGADFSVGVLDGVEGDSSSTAVTFVLSAAAAADEVGPEVVVVLTIMFVSLCICDS